MCELVSSDLLSVCRVYVIIFKYEHPHSLRFHKKTYSNLNVFEFGIDRILQGIRRPT